MWGIIECNPFPMKWRWDHYQLNCLKHEWNFCGSFWNVNKATKLTIFNINVYFIFLIFYVFIFRERGKEGERGWEKHQCAVASHTPPTGDLAHNPGMHPGWESNLWPFGSQTGTQPIKPHQKGQIFILIIRQISSKREREVEFHGYISITLSSPVLFLKGKMCRRGKAEGEVRQKGRGQELKGLT